MQKPLSEVLGSTPQETAEVKEKFKVVIPCFKGTVLPMQFTFEPLNEEDGTHRCFKCLEPAEHKETTEADPLYRAFYCTICRDKANTPRKTKEIREVKYSRYAGYHRNKPSLTVDEYLLIVAAQASREKSAGQSAL